MGGTTNSNKDVNVSLSNKIDSFISEDEEYAVERVVDKRKKRDGTVCKF